MSLAPTKPPRPTMDAATALIPERTWRALSSDTRGCARRAIALAIHLDGPIGRLTPQGAALAGLSAIGIVARTENGLIVVPTQPNLTRGY